MATVLTTERVCLTEFLHERLENVTNLIRAMIANGDIIKAQDDWKLETCLLQILLLLNFLFNLFAMSFAICVFDHKI